ncbi:MAG: class I SAM-dependent methyltransferase, partial [Trueperaceae bacterium]
MKCTGPNHRDWYDAIATRNGGYRKTWSSTIEGESGEDVFRDTLLNLLEPHMEVLDAGCGSAEFSIEVARQVRHLTGFDFSENMVRRAKANATSAGAINCNYIVASTHNMPFSDASFDLIYSRRGPTSILLNPQILRKGGWMLGVHSSGAEVIQERIEASGLEDIE